MKSVLALVFAASLCRTLALPGGAPPQACENLTPGHGATPRPGRSSNTVDITAFRNDDMTNDICYQYMPGVTYNMSLFSTGIFRGFLIQARRTMDPTEIVGEFSLAENETDVRLSSCTPNNIAVTHNNRDDKTEVEFLWTAPSASVGPIRFHFTTVRNFTIYWVNETSSQIFGPEGPPPSPMVEGSAPITTVSLWSVLSVALTVALKQMF